MKFKAGDLVWVTCHKDTNPMQLDGNLPGVVEGLRSDPLYPYTVSLDGIRSAGSTGNFRCMEKILSPREPPKKEREPLGEWSLCPWAPQEYVHA